MDEISDRDFKMINRGIEIGAKHNEPSPKTLDAINSIQGICATRGTEIALMQKSIDNIEASVEELKEANKTYQEEIKELIIGLETKFSAKWVEKILLWVAYIIGGSLILGFIGLLWKIIVQYLTGR